MSETTIHSVKKALAILDILVFDDIDRNGMRLFNLAKKIDQKPNTVHNILKTMVACGYVIQNDKSQYLAGPKCDEMINAGRLSNNSVLIRKLKPLLYKLCERINESVILTALVNGNRIPLVSIKDSNIIRVDMSSDEMSHIYERPTGRVLVAFADATSFQNIRTKWGYPGEKWDNTFDDTAFNKLRKTIREQGYIIKSEYNDTIISIAVPVKDSAGRAMYSLGSYAPSFRCDSEKQEIILKELKETADILSNLI